MSTSQYEAEARGRKASRLAQVFIAQARKVGTPDEMLGAMAKAAAPESWRTIATLAGIRPPSPETIATAVGLVSVAVEGHPADPFAGLS